MRAAEEQSASRQGEGGAPSASFPGLDQLLESFLEEDVGTGDVTTDTLVPTASRGVGRLRVKQPGVLAGLPVFARVFEKLDPGSRSTFLASDGDAIAVGDIVCEIHAGTRALLTGERTALNLVQRMSGIATATRRFVEAAAGGAGIYDTRKTTPGLRMLEKYAVVAGGGVNHRFALYDEAMIKNNHVDATGDGLADLIAKLRRERGEDFVIHAEARDEEEAFAAVRGGADVVMLDNMDVARMTTLVEALRAQARELGREVSLEASGGVNLDTVAAIAGCGVDRVSVGALTHSAPALDLSFGIEVLS